MSPLLMINPHQLPNRQSTRLHAIQNRDLGLWW